MLGNRRPAPRGLIRPDLAIAHITLAMIYLVLTAGVGVALLRSVHDCRGSRALIMLYGILGLLGFLAQMVVGVSVRLLPLYAWMRQFSFMGFDQVPPSPHELALRPLHWSAFVLWVAGIPLLATGLSLDLPLTIQIAGTLLGTAVVISLVHLVLLLKRHATTGVERIEIRQS